MAIHEFAQFPFHFRMLATDVHVSLCGRLLSRAIVLCLVVCLTDGAAVFVRWGFHATWPQWTLSANRSREAVLGRILPIVATSNCGGLSRRTRKHTTLGVFLKVLRSK